MKQQTERSPFTTASSLAAKDKAIVCSRLALEKKAYDVRILHIGMLSTIAEYFVICSGRSVRQVRAIAEHVQCTLKEHRQDLLGIEGGREGTWILLDYADVVVHVFYEATREIFCLEKLWSDAPLLVDPERDAYEKIHAPGSEEEMEEWDD